MAEFDIQNYSVGQRSCYVCDARSKQGVETAVLIQPVDDHDLDAMQEELQTITASGEASFVWVGFKIDDWNNELSPWEAAPVFGNEPFGTGASETLGYVQNELIPWIRNELLSMDMPENTINTGADVYKWIIGGYSLAGFFALWAACQTDQFEGVVGASPSVWFPGWLDYLREHPMQVEKVYLSLGDKEPKTRNPIMSTVGDCIEETQQIVSAKLGDDSCIFEWNKGNHFQKAGERTGKGFAWILRGVGRV